MSNLLETRPKQRLPIWRQLEELPLPKTEESILLRVLVQALVIVGILATDVAAEVPLDEVPISLWAIPLSIVGAVLSWHRRRDRNIGLKFVLAILMLGALALFFRNLFDFSQPKDTRLVLAQLLIQVQVLHSFDLPRRKDLGYSMVIALILMGVAGTISQTLTFAPLLLVFLAIAIPVLVLDYRSRLGLIPAKSGVGDRKSKVNAILPTRNSYRQLGIMFGAILALGLTIFAFMPRFPGYQLQSFPINAPSQLKDQDFDQNNSGIRNPGYVREGRRRDGRTRGSGQGEGEPGQMDDTFYYGFNSKINQNLRGQLTPKVVMRVRSQAEGFWRVLAFDRYTGQGWEISREDQTQTLGRSSWSYRFFVDFPRTKSVTKEVIQTYTIVSNLPNLIPALATPRDLYFPTLKVKLDTEGSLQSPSELPEGLTYTVISIVPYRDETALAAAPIAYNSNIRAHYLQVPPAIADKIRQFTEEILAKSEKPLTSPYWKTKYLAQYLKQRFSIPQNPLELPTLAENEDLVDAFLFKYKGGYPDHFSTTLTIMLRSIGIPARLVGGFMPGKFNPFTGLYIVENTDAYLMTEVYFPSYGWFTFDPIPGHPLIPPSIEQNQTFSALQAFWKWVAGILPSPVTGWINALFEGLTRWLVGAVIWLWAILSNGWIGFFTGIILAIAISFVGWLGWTQLSKLRYRLWLAKLPPMESLYHQMLNFLADQGFRKHPAQTPLEYVQTAYEHQPREYAKIIEEISQAYVGWRYGYIRPNLSQMRQLLKQLQQTKKL